MENMPIEAVKSSFQSIPPDQIKPSRHQARQQFDEEALKGLAESMKQEGLLQPITVRHAGDGYELIGGERRFRAAKLLGWTTIDAKVIQTVSEGEAAAKGLIENLQREDLNPIEESAGFQELHRLDPTYWTQDRIVQICGKSKAYVSRSFSLLGLPKEIQTLVATWQLSRSHAEVLLAFTDPKQQIAFAKDILKHNWSVREAEKRIKLVINASAGKHTKVLDSLPIDTRDPLAYLWPEPLADTSLAPLKWQVEYGKEQNNWTFHVKIPGLIPKVELGKWFQFMAQTFSTTEALVDPPSRSGGEGPRQEVKEPVKAAPEPAPAATDQETARLPKTPAEEAELLKLAEESMAKAYAWIYGPGTELSFGARQMTWQNTGFGNAKEGLATLLAALRAEEKGG